MLLFLSSLVDLLPQLVGRLQRRRGAFLLEALPGVLGVAWVRARCSALYLGCRGAAATGATPRFVRSRHLPPPTHAHPP